MAVSCLKVGWWYRRVLSFGFRTGVVAVMRFLYIQVGWLAENQSVVVVELNYRIFYYSRRSQLWTERVSVKTVILPVLMHLEPIVPWVTF